MDVQLNVQVERGMIKRYSAPPVYVVIFSTTKTKIKMKSMCYKQLGGACETEFYPDTFDEMAELSKQHGIEMCQKQNAKHA